MDLYGIARQQIDTSMRDQFRDAPESDRTTQQATPRTGIVTSLRARLGADLHALAAAIEPRQPLHPNPSGSHR